MKLNDPGMSNFQKFRNYMHFSRRLVSVGWPGLFDFSAGCYYDVKKDAFRRGLSFSVMPFFWKPGRWRVTFALDKIPPAGGNFNPPWYKGQIPPELQAVIDPKNASLGGPA